MFISWQFAVMSVGIYAILQAVVRTPVESRWPYLKTSEWWRGFGLVTLPIVFGILVGVIAKKFPMPNQAQWEASRSFRCLFGAIAGMFSGWVYSLAKTLIRKATGAPAEPTDRTDPAHPPSSPKDPT
jgi:hypothetical protein